MKTKKKPPFGAALNYGKIIMIDFKYRTYADGQTDEFEVRVAGTDQWDHYELRNPTGHRGVWVQGQDLESHFIMNDSHRTKKSTIIAKIYEWLLAQEKYAGEPGVAWI